MSRVTELPAADPTAARTHFEGLMAYETDCWDVHASLGDAQGFVLLDVRAPQSFEEGHVPGAVGLPHGRSTSGTWPRTPPTRSSLSTATDRTVTALIARPHAWRALAGRSRR
jgi:rhodanese-related sulfurtransferase